MMLLQLHSSLLFRTVFVTFFWLLQAFFEGKLKVSGNTALAMKLQSVVPSPGKAKI